VALSVTYVSAASCKVYPWGVIRLYDPLPNALLRYWILLSWPVTAALDLFGLSCTIQQSNFIGSSGGAVFFGCGCNGAFYDRFLLYQGEGSEPFHF
jgi:hypothetical protein